MKMGNFRQINSSCPWFKLYFYCIIYDNDKHDDNNTDFTYNKDSEVSQLRLL